MLLEVLTICLRVILVILSIGVGIAGIIKTNDSNELGSERSMSYATAIFMILFGIVWTIVIGFQIYNLGVK